MGKIKINWLLFFTLISGSCMSQTINIKELNKNKWYSLQNLDSTCNQSLFVSNKNSFDSIFKYPCKYFELSFAKNKYCTITNDNCVEPPKSETICYKYSPMRLFEFEGNSYLYILKEKIEVYSIDSIISDKKNKILFVSNLRKN